MTTAAAIALLLPAIPESYHDLARFLVRWEGLRTAAYQDAADYWTIGVGHRLPAGVRGDTLRWPISSIASHLVDDIDEARRRAVFDGWSDLHPVQRDALTALAFNVGSLQGTKLQALLSQRGVDLQVIVREWVSWDHAGHKELRGLLLRRLEEATMFVTGARHEE